MYYGKKKAIIISIIIVLLVIVLAVVGLFLFTATDLFKSNETLFFKYVANQYEQLSTGITNDQLKDIINTQKEMSYETNATLELRNNEDENEETNINIIIREDKANDKQYANLKADYYKDENKKMNLIDLHYVKSNNIYALKWEEIVLKHFVGIENKDLKEFAKKLGIEDTQNLPDEITTNYQEILELTEQEKQHIMQTYSNVLLENIPSEKYTKQNDMAITKNGVNYNATAYRLDLSEQEIRNIIIKLLEELKEDSITLNLITTKAKLMNLSEEYTTISGLTNGIEEIINEINSEEIDNSKGLSIVVYEYKGQAVLTEIILKNEMKLTITSDVNNNTSTTNVQIYNLSEEEEYGTINLKIVTTQTSYESTQVNIDVNIDDEQTLSIWASNVGVAAKGSVQTTMRVTLVNEEGEITTADYNAQTTYGTLTEEIEDLDGTKNCIVLNKYSAETLKTTLDKIKDKLAQVILTKSMTIALSEVEVQIETDL